MTDAPPPQNGIPPWLIRAFVIKLVIITAIVIGVVWWANR